MGFSRAAHRTWDVEVPGVVRVEDNFLEGPLQKGVGVLHEVLVEGVGQGDEEDVRLLPPPPGEIRRGFPSFFTNPAPTSLTLYLAEADPARRLIRAVFVPGPALTRPPDMITLTTRHARP